MVEKTFAKIAAVVTNKRSRLNEPNPAVSMALSKLVGSSISEKSKIFIFSHGLEIENYL